MKSVRYIYMTCGLVLKLQAYENQKTEEQVDDIADWLDRTQSTASAGGVHFYRLPVGILQRQLPSSLAGFSGGELIR
jgi:hypothetical protein